MDEEVLIKILREDPVVGANKELMFLVQQYLDLNCRTQNLCLALQKYLKEAIDNQISIERALNMLPAMEDQRLLSQKECKNILDELKVFISAAERSYFGDNICLEEFRTVHVKHLEMQSKLGILKKKFDKKVRYLKGLMKGCSLVASLLKGLTGTYTQPSLSDIYGGRWFKSLACYKGEVGLVENMKLATFSGCKDLETMKVLVGRLQGEMGRIVASIKFGERRANCYALLLAMERIRREKAGFLKTVEDIEKYTEVFNKRVSQARTVVWQKIVTGRRPLMEN